MAAGFGVPTNGEALGLGGGLRYAVFADYMGEEPWPDSMCESEDQARLNLARARMLVGEHVRAWPPGVREGVVDSLYVAEIRGVSPPVEKEEL